MAILPIQQEANAVKSTLHILIIILSLTVVHIQTNGQGCWTQKADFGGPAREGSVGFSIGNKGYVGTGLLNGSIKMQDFWEYDSPTNTWTQLADFPGSPRCEATGFAIGTKGYLGFGMDGSTIFSDFWEYDPVLNSWTIKNSSLIPARYLTSAFSIGNTGYIGTGITSSGDSKDFWQYNPTTDSWTQKANFGGSARRAAVGISIAETGYIGLGGYTGNLLDFWKYDPLNNSWTQIANYPGIGRGYPVAFAIDSSAYIGMGYNPNSSPRTLNDFWEYNASSNSWSTVSTYAGGYKCEGIAFTINQKGYVGTGALDSGFTYNMHKDFWEYDPNGVSITENNQKNSISIFPNPFSGQTTLQAGNLPYDATLSVVNCFGETIKQISNISGHTITLFRDNLPSGPYFLLITQNSKVIATGKLVITDP